LKHGFEPSVDVQNTRADTSLHHADWSGKLLLKSPDLRDG